MLAACLAAAITPLLVAPTARAEMPRPPHIVVVRDDCPTGGGPCADTDNGIIYVGRYPSRFGRSHEIGHLFDAQLLTDADRVSFTALLGMTGPWDQGTGDHGYDSPQERFADAYSACDLGLKPGRGLWVVAYDYLPTPSQHRHVCSAIMRIGEARLGVAATVKIADDARRAAEHTWTRAVASARQGRDGP